MDEDAQGTAFMQAVLDVVIARRALGRAYEPFRQEGVRLVGDPLAHEVMEAPFEALVNSVAAVAPLMDTAPSEAQFAVDWLREIGRHVKAMRDAISERGAGDAWFDIEPAINVILPEVDEGSVWSGVVRLLDEHSDPLRDFASGAHIGVSNAVMPRCGESTAQIFEHLKTQFLRLHGEQAEQLFLLQAFDHSELQDELDCIDVRVIQTGVSVRFMATPEIGEPWDPVPLVFPVGCVRAGYPRDFDVGPEELRKAWLHAWQQFRLLADCAGNFVPKSLRDSIDLWQDRPRLAVWLQLMYVFVRPDTKLRVWDSERHGRWTISINPFQDAANAIEECRLNTPEPILPPVLRKRQAWKEWADRLAQDAGQTAPEEAVRTTNADAEVSSAEGGTASGPWSSIQVDHVACKLRFQGVAYSVSSEAARMVGLLVDAQGEWVPMRENGFSKPSSVKKGLPTAIRDHLETSKGKGYRLKRR